MLPFLQEEVWEVMDAIRIDPASPETVAELGDLLFVTLLTAHTLGGRASLDAALRAASAKMRDRHPHVFQPGAPAPASWSAAKGEAASLLDDLPLGAPALSHGQAIADRVAEVGFDWPDWRGARAKIDEELHELDEAIAASDAAAQHHELGDVLMSVTNLARKLAIDAEGSLRTANQRFCERIRHMERHADRPLVEASPETLDRWWEQAKVALKSPR